MNFERTSLFLITSSNEQLFFKIEVNSGRSHQGLERVNILQLFTKIENNNCFSIYTRSAVNNTRFLYLQKKPFHSRFNEHPAGLRSKAAGHSCVMHLFQRIEKKKTFQQLENKKTFQSQFNEHPAGLRSRAAGHRRDAFISRNKTIQVIEDMGKTFVLLG